MMSMVRITLSAFAIPRFHRFVNFIDIRNTGQSKWIIYCVERKVSDRTARVSFSKGKYYNVGNSLFELMT